ncbi:hypothetical protein BH20ACI1_BH20ACI1_20980 [soil metagenome]
MPNFQFKLFNYYMTEDFENNDNREGNAFDNLTTS